MLGPNFDLGTLGLSEFHHSLAMANLIDDSVFDDGWATRNRHKESSGAGLTATGTVMWRVRGKGVLLSYNAGHGFVLGSGPQLQVHTSLVGSPGVWDGEASAPEDWHEGAGQAAGLRPLSLYQDQRARRLGL